jgi:hypothetical protein
MRKVALSLLALASLLPLPAAAQEGAPAGKDWKDHMGDIPFLVGREAGLREVEFTGKPILFFYTATW